VQKPTQALKSVKGIGQAKALQVYSAVALIKRFYQEQNNTDLIINNVQNVLTLMFFFLVSNIKSKCQHILYIVDD
jgi:DNA repair protein RadC